MSVALTACGQGGGSEGGLYETGNTFTSGGVGTATDTAADGSTSDSSSSTNATDDGSSGDGDASSGDGDTTTSGDGDTTSSGDGDASSGDGDTTTSGDGDTTSSGDGDSSTTSSTTSATDSTTGGEVGCEGVDFLFVIDNSGSMGDEQAALIASFDGFIDSIEAQLAEIGADSFNIMVTDTDAASFEPDAECLLSCGLTNFTGQCLFNGNPCELYNPLCITACQINPTGMCGGFSCSDLACDSGDPCSCEIGSGTVTTPGGSSCGVTSGNLYMDQNQVDPKAAFGCMANVGTDGSGSERQMDAMTQAISPAFNGNGGCNQGFVRDNAILVVTVITDEPDGSSGNPTTWKNALLNAKFNDEAGIVVLGLIGDPDQPDAVCGSLSGTDGASEAPQIRSFINSMQNGVIGSVCAPSYNEFFADAVALIEDTCISFPIPE